jgi:hypothetical protein
MVDGIVRIQMEVDRFDFRCFNHSQSLIFIYDLSLST